MAGLENCPCCSDIASIIPKTYKTWAVNHPSLIDVVKKGYKAWTCQDMDVYYSNHAQDYFVIYDYDNIAYKYWEAGVIGLFFSKSETIFEKYTGALIVLHPSLYGASILQSVVTHEIGHSLGMPHSFHGSNSVMNPHLNQFVSEPTVEDFYIFTNLGIVNEKLGDQASKTTDNILKQKQQEG